MKRNAFMMDLLRPGIMIDDLVDWMDNKRELTPEDIQQIIDVAEKIIAAGVTVQRRTVK